MAEEEKKVVCLVDLEIFWMEMVFRPRSVSYLYLFCIVFINCKSSKKISNGPLPERSQSEIVQSLLKRNIDFDFFNIRGVADFEALGMGGSGTMNLRIKKDNLIWLQGKKLGIEGFRGIINRDSFTMVNRLEGSYFYEANEAISSMFGIGFRFDEIQELLAGNILPFSDKDVTDYQQLENQCLLTINTAQYNIILNIDAFSLQLKEYRIKDRMGNLAVAKFDDYQKIEKTKYTSPYIRNYYFKSREGDEGKIELNVSELELNIEKSLIFNLPLHYDRLRL
jgi:hypothetical protein